jgi:hypothetical protein
MGMFDYITDGTKHGQTKAFNPGMATIKIGGKVAIEEIYAEMLDGTPAVKYSDGQVNCADGGWLIVRDGIWTEWADHPVPDLQRFDNIGRPVADDYERYPHDESAID